jgi:cell division protein FtsI/penicillin-binding protein 2
MRKNNKFEKYNFNINTYGKTYEYKNIFTIIREWVIRFINFLIYQWTHNRLMFLLILSLIFILGYYIYANYIKKENELEKTNEKENTETLNNIVRRGSEYRKKIKKSIPKKHEIRCRIIMEQLFKAPFVSLRPDFLKYKTGKNLELDVFNADLMIALEYDGVHHRKFTEFFHKSEQDFIEQQERDRFKEEKCKELGITLIRVPDTVKFDNLEDYIKNELDKREIFYFK